MAAVTEVLVDAACVSYIYHSWRVFLHPEESRELKAFLSAPDLLWRDVDFTIRLCWWWERSPAVDLIV